MCLVQKSLKNPYYHIWQIEGSANHVIFPQLKRSCGICTQPLSHTHPPLKWIYEAGISSTALQPPFHRSPSFGTTCASMTPTARISRWVLHQSWGDELQGGGTEHDSNSTRTVASARQTSGRSSVGGCFTIHNIAVTPRRQTHLVLGHVLATRPITLAACLGILEVHKQTLERGRGKQQIHHEMQ